MATIKAFTDLSQSKVLAKILRLESADMYYTSGVVTPDIMIGSKQDYRCYTMCWSLAALLGVLPEYNLQRTDWENKTEYKILVTIDEDNYASKNYDNPIDACYEIILKLNELNLL